MDSINLDGFGKVVLAGMLGMLVGLNRELARRPAGLRTHIFVAAGAALFVVLGDGVVNQFRLLHPEEALSADPLRIIQAVVVGIGFVAAGTIFRTSDTTVEGVTTAASIFFTAGIGVAVAVERTALAVASTLMALGVLGVLGWFEWHTLMERGEKTPPDDTPPQ